MIAGTLTYDTKMDTNGFKNGLTDIKGQVSSIKNIVAGLGITKIIEKGISTINANLDGAIKRYDTLKNFPKVMSNLGIASEDANKSIKLMSDKLAGLPTTLDEGAMAVQRFTSKNGNVKKSTDIFLALNNAILAGGASAEIQSTALEQLAQAYAKGKPDMMEWRSAMTAMPAQLKQVATAMRYTDADKLGEALRKGTASMDDFMDAIIKLNTEGIDGLNSFEEQARNATGGIATAITVAKTQVVKGIADIIEKTNEILSKTPLKSISDIIANIGKKAKVFLDMIADNLPNILKMTPAILGVIGGLKVGIPLLEKVNEIVGMIPGKFGMIAKILTSSLSPVLIGGALIAGLGFLNESTGGAIEKIIDTITEKAPGIITKFIKAINDNIPKILKSGGKLFESILKTINDNIPTITKALLEIINGLITIFLNNLPMLIQIRNYINSFINSRYCSGLTNINSNDSKCYNGNSKYIN